MIVEIYVRFYIVVIFRFFLFMKNSKLFRKNNEKYFRNILIRIWILDSCVKSNVM